MVKPNRHLPTLQRAAFLSGKLIRPSTASPHRGPPSTREHPANTSSPINTGPSFTPTICPCDPEKSPRLCDGYTAAAQPATQATTTTTKTTTASNWS